MDKWQSKGLHEHPAKHRKGTYGMLCLSWFNIYYLRIGGIMMNCPQDWAAGIHKKEDGK